jgi:hypothetical protein
MSVSLRTDLVTEFRCTPVPYQRIHPIISSTFELLAAEAKWLSMIHTRASAYGYTLFRHETSLDAPWGRYGRICGDGLSRYLRSFSIRNALVHSTGIIRATSALLPTGNCTQRGKLLSEFVSR